MKAVMPQGPEHLLRWRKQTGADRWDEMWEGVLHMAPAPNRDHQDLEAALEMWLRLHWARPRGNRVYHQINVAAPGGCRIPDLVLLTPDRFHIDRNEYFDGAPTAVVEIHSPGDEAYEKLSFYARLGVSEVWILHRDSKVPELYVLHADRHRQLAADDERRLVGPATEVLLRPGRAGKLEIQLAGAPATRTLLPE